MISSLIGAVLAAVAGTMGFALLLHAPRRAWLPASGIGGVSYGLYWGLMQASCPAAAAIFLSALAGSLLGQWCARRMRMIATVFVTLSIVSLVPGLGLYRCMELLAQGDSAAGVRSGVTAMIDVVMIALGVGVGSFLHRLILALPRKENEHGL